MFDSAERQLRTRLPQDMRREQLMNAAIEVIADQGLSSVTLGKVADRAGLTAGMVNFHFETKQDLLNATLSRLSAEIQSLYQEALDNPGIPPAQRLLQLTDACFDPQVATPEKLAVWFAFWGEGGARSTYLEICGAADRTFYDVAIGLVGDLVAQTGSDVDVRTTALALSGLVDLLWWKVVIRQITCAEAAEDCQRFLLNLFPKAFAARDSQPTVDAEPPSPTDHAYPDRLTLPAWTYRDANFNAHEIEQIHLQAWQLVCHVSDIAEVGDYVTLNILGKRAVAIRGEDGQVRAFHNVCRHRGHEVVQGRNGNCGPVMRCPYHAWCYDTKGVLKGVAASRTFPRLDKDNLGLFPIESEVFLGFVFIRFASAGPSVAERFAPYGQTLAPYGIEDMAPIADLWEDEIQGDWKNVWDNYLEDYHFPTGHPGLSALMGKEYEREPDPQTRTMRLSHKIRDRVDGPWSTRAYSRLLPEAKHLPAEQRRCWSYHFLYPAVSIETYPDMIDFFHVVPLGPGRSLLRWRAYGRPNASRELKAAQWLNRRINLGVHFEDSTLVESVQRNLEAGVYERGVLGDKEVSVKAFHDWIRDDLPDAR